MVKDKKQSGHGETLVKVPRKSLVVDEAVQSRCGLDDDHVERMIDSVNNGKKNGTSVKLPPISVVKTAEGKFIVWDGFHRLGVHEKLHTDKVECMVRNGTIETAIELAAGANAEHGKPRNGHDMERAVIMLLRPEWANKPTEWLAKTAKVSWHFADKIRKAHGGKPERVTDSSGREQHATKPDRVRAREHGDDTEPDEEHEATSPDDDDVFSVKPPAEPAVTVNPGPDLRLETGTMEDQYDRPVHARLVPVFEHRRTLAQLKRKQSELTSEIITALRHESKAGVMIHLGTIESAGRTIIDTMGGGMVDAQCPECAGEPASDGNDPCPRCDGRGWLHHTAVKSLPPRLRKVVEEHVRKEVG